MANSDYHELPEVLRFNKYGGVLSPQERINVAKSKGLCNKCGKVTHKVTALRSIPLDNSNVKRGVCLVCHPEHRELKLTRQGSSRLGLARIAGDKASKLLGDASLPPMPKKNGSRKRADFKASFATSVLSNDTYRSKWTNTARMLSSLTSSSSSFNSNAPASAFSHGGVVPASGSVEMDPIRQLKMNNSLKKPSSQHSSDSRDEMMKIEHDFSAPQNNEDAWDIVAQMRGNPNDIDLLMRKCHELRSIGTNSAGALYEIIEVMRRHPNDRNLQFAAIGALWSVSADGDDDSKAEAIDAGAANVIIDAITFFPGDINLVCWGIGALSSFAEGIAGRSSLIDCGTLDTLETVLEKYYKAESKVACAICYWVFRCLLLLVISYEDNMNESFMSSFIISDTISDMRSDRDWLEVFINTVSKHNIVHLVVTAMASSSMDAMTLSTAFTFLCHIPKESFEDDEWILLTKIVPPVIKEKSYLSFPVMRMLAFAMLCELIQKSSATQPLSNASIVAVREALRKLVPRRVLLDKRASLDSQSMNLDLPPYNIIQDIMICTLSHALTYSDMDLRFSESKTALKTAIAILSLEEAPLFAKTSCCWIIFGVFRGSPTIKNTLFARNAAESILSAMVMHQSSPHILTIGFAALSASGAGLTQGKPLVDMVIGLKSRFPKEKSLLKEACRFLGNCCESKESVDYILSAGGLEFAMTLLDDKHKSQGREAVHLIYKFVVFSGTQMLSLYQCHIIFEVRDLAEDNMLLAAEMVYILSKAVTRSSNLFTDFCLKKSDSVRKLKRNDSQGILYPVSETFLFFDFVVGVTEAFGSDRNFMKCACVAIKNIALTVQRSKLPLRIERPILVIQKALVYLKGLHAPIDAIWALMGVDHPPLERNTMRDVSLSMITYIEGSIGTRGNQFLESVVQASLAVLTSIFLETRFVKMKDNKDLLEIDIVERVVELVLTIFFSCLDKHGNFPSIFKYGFQLLQCLCDDDVYLSIIIKHGGIVAIVDAMMTNMDNAAIQTSGCIILRHLSEADNLTKTNVIEADGVDLLFDIVTTPEKDLNLIEEAMRAILSLSLGQESRIVVEEEGGVSVVCKVLSLFPDSLSVQETGLATLCFIASDVDGSSLEASSLFTTIRDALTCHQHHSNIYQNGFALLGILSGRSAANRSLLVSSGCLNCVMDSITKKQYPPKIVGSAFEVLVKVTANSKEYRGKILSQPKLLKSIIFTMMSHVECYKIQIDGCQLIFRMSEMIESSRVISAGGVKAVLCAMMAHSMSKEIQFLACTLLSRFCSDPAFLKRCSSDSNDIGAEMIMDAIMRAKVNFPGSNQVRNTSSKALEQIQMLSFK